MRFGSAFALLFVAAAWPGCQCGHLDIGPKNLIDGIVAAAPREGCSNGIRIFA